MSYQSSENFSQQTMQSDRPLFIAVVFLVVIGLMAIFSASAPKCLEMGVNPAKFLIQQIIGVILGFVGLKFLSNFHYKKLIHFTFPYAVFVIIMLVAVKVCGVTVNGAQRWIYIGPMSCSPQNLLNRR
jgi:cell division protein FtsW